MIDKLLTVIRKEALQQSVPIMDEDSLLFIAEFIGNYQIKKLLEIGTAVGYSAITMCSRNPDLQLLSLEKDRERYLKARDNVEKAGLSASIRLLNCDARKFESSEKFDLIILDGSKAHNSELLSRYERNLVNGGYFIIDDVHFHGFIEKPETVRSRRLRRLVRKFTEFQKEIGNNVNYECSRLKIGDGLLIAQKKEI